MYYLTQYIHIKHHHQSSMRYLCWIEKQRNLKSVMWAWVMWPSTEERYSSEGRHSVLYMSKGSEKDRIFVWMKYRGLTKERRWKLKLIAAGARWPFSFCGPELGLGVEPIGISRVLLNFKVSSVMYVFFNIFVSS